MTVRAEVWLTSVCVYVNDTLHLMFRRSAFMGLQSWPDENCYSIEITLAGSAPILTRYEKHETWAAVLDALAKLDITAV